MSSCLKLADFERLNQGGLDKGAAAKLHAHLDGCDACRVAYEQFLQDDSFLANAKAVLQSDSQSQTAQTDSGAVSLRRASKVTPEIEGYRIIDVLGHGGMGIVYRAVQMKLNRAVALKVLPAMIGAASPSAVSRFRREATAAARLHHTHIVPIYDFGESHDAYYYAMELILGQPLNVVIQQFAEHNAASASPVRLAELLLSTTSEVVGPASAGTHAGLSSDDAPSMTGVSSGGRGRLYYRQVARWMADAADALHYAHGQGIIHRDVKPANLILSTDGRIMVADFGLAKSVDEESVTLTGSLLGTIRYLSPEQAMARRVPVDHRTDVYSLGATMYELLCFQPAFLGDDDKQILSAVISRDPIPPRKVASGVPHELETICLKALEKSPAVRYLTARAFAEDLRRYTHDLPIVAKRPGPLARAVKFVRRRKAQVIAVAASVVLVMTIPLISYINKKRVENLQAAFVADERRIENKIEELNTQAHSLFVRGQNKMWQEAAGLYEQALLLEPKNVKTLTNYAIMCKEWYNALDDPDDALLEKAVVLYTRALEIGPNDSNGWNIKGVLHKKIGQYEEAIAAYNEVFVIYENTDEKSDELERVHAAAWENCGVSHALNGDLKRAEQHLLKAADLEAVALGPQTVWQSMTALRVFQRRGDAADAIQRAIAIDKTDPWSSLIRSCFRRQLEGDEDKGLALDDAKFAHRSADDFGPRFRRIANRVLALAYLRNGEFDNAASYAKQALKVGDMATLNELVVTIAEANNGEPAAAGEALDRALAAWPEDLLEAGQHRVSAPDGILWIETAEELLALRKEAEELLAQTSP